MAKLLSAYAENGSFKILRSTVPLQAKLELVVSDYMDALEKNGYDPTQVLKSAKGMVMPWLYSEFFKAFEDGNAAGTQAAANKIVRMQGTAQSLSSSYANRKTRERGNPPTVEEKQAMLEAFEGMLPPMYKLKGLDR